MIRINNIKLKIGNDDISSAVCKSLKIATEDIIELHIRKKSLDARKKKEIHYLYTVDAEVKNENTVLKKCKDKNVALSSYKNYTLPDAKVNIKERPVVVGFGPAGMLAGLVLAQKGLKPIILERGKNIDARSEDVESFWDGGKFNTESNVQFGEGGAGTFSDGKLTTRIKDARCGYVTECFVKAGAPAEISYDAKPHIGTDRLKIVVKNIRKEIINLGGEVRFESRLSDILIENGSVIAAVVNGNEEINTKDIIIAVGHSARDTFKMLYDKNIAIEQKPFAAGVRIEHRQCDINTVQYGDAADKLPPADYMMTYTTKEGRGVYSFCMCPGGYVVAAASEEGRLVVNGMSEYARDGENANSALLVQVYPEDFESDSPLAGIEFQRRIEEKAFTAGGRNYSAPTQRYEDFKLGRITKKEGSIVHSYRPSVTFADLNNVLPKFISDSIKEAIPEMGKKLKGFDCEDALLTGVETRSSSPVRITRDPENGYSINIKGLYPAGEGAGYAGGIISAAADGIRQAENLLLNNKE
ncbi:hypothetical protein SDC9_85198 [bioreactor metagenome]|uniref:FAD-dependent protein C-terminal domain-containing protein n=1 Tax=bioreactor metagenome TaxID=1076179 RepID=A0A644ZCU2_9ZZZZ|nr:hypothetical protein [Candidatus Metalachnospira sp.]